MDKKKVDFKQRITELCKSNVVEKLHTETHWEDIKLLFLKDYHEEIDCLDYLDNLKPVFTELLEQQANTLASSGLTVNYVPMKAYIYLLREREFLLRKENVYKVGRTKQLADNRIKRVESYKKGSEVILVVNTKVNLNERIERNIINLFNKEFIRHSDGHEYFIGDPDRMIKLIISTINEEEINSENDTNIVIEKPTKNSIFKKDLIAFLEKEHYAKQLQILKKEGDILFVEQLMFRMKIFQIELHNITEQQVKLLFTNDESYEKKLFFQLISNYKSYQIFKESAVTTNDKSVKQIIKHIEPIKWLEQKLSIKPFDVMSIVLESKELGELKLKLIDRKELFMDCGSASCAKKREQQWIARIEKINEVTKIKKLLSDFYNLHGELIIYKSKRIGRAANQNTVYSDFRLNI